MRLNLDWPALNLIESEMTVTSTIMGVSDHTLLIQCDEGNLVIDCKLIQSPSRDACGSHLDLGRMWLDSSQCPSGIPAHHGLDPPYRPISYSIRPHGDHPFRGKMGSIEKPSSHQVEMPPVGFGYYFEADEVARCVRDGNLESERMPLEESRVVQGWLDSVRKGNDSVLKNYPSRVSSEH